MSKLVVTAMVGPGGDFELRLVNHHDHDAFKCDEAFNKYVDTFERQHDVTIDREGCSDFDEFHLADPENDEEAMKMALSLLTGLSVVARGEVTP